MKKEKMEEKANDEHSELWKKEKKDEKIKTETEILDGQLDGMSLNSFDLNANAVQVHPQVLDDEESDVAELEPVNETFGSLGTLRVTNRRLPEPENPIDLTPEWSLPEWMAFHKKQLRIVRE